MRKKPTWIWYYGDFEIHQRLLVDTRRLEENLYRPAPWRLDDCWHNVMFRKTFHLERAERFKVTIDGIGSVRINQRYCSTSEWLEAPAGEVTIDIEAANVTGMPAVFVEGDTIVSDPEWQAAYDNFHFSPVGFWNLDDENTPPSRFALPCRPLALAELPCENGRLYDAGRETFCRLRIRMAGEGAVRIYYGESMTEVMDEQPNMWIDVDAAPERTEPARAFRYLRIVPAEGVTVQQVEAFYEYLPLTRRGEFSCPDEMLNRIWDVSCYTLELNSREFFLDGIKRDRYLWSGDAYQSYLLNYYLFFDNEICKRTTLALRGKDPMERHINTIMDYSFYWVLGLADYYRYTGDRDFIMRIYPRAESLMEFCRSRVNADGLLDGRPEDWVFLDWAPLDKDGPICAEQILFAKSLETMAELGEQLGRDTSVYRAQAAALRGKIQQLYWNGEKGAFVDSYTSGREVITRQTNIFAVRFGIADERQAALIVQNVLQNSAVTPITTPYFKFYELESLCHMGQQEAVTEKMLDYWGGMLQLGATSFWEEYDPALPDDGHYSMYGKAYGKSLCHAWGASPIYLLGRFYLGVNPTGEGYRSFTVEPNPGGLPWIRGAVPVPGGKIRVFASAEKAEVLSDIPGGVLLFGGRSYEIPAGETLVVQR